MVSYPRFSSAFHLCKNIDSAGNNTIPQATSHHQKLSDNKVNPLELCLYTVLESKIPAMYDRERTAPPGFIAGANFCTMETKE